MKKVIKYVLVGCSLFLIWKNNPKAKNQFELIEPSTQITYMIEKGIHKFQLYFYIIRDIETKEYLYCLEPGVALSNEVYEQLQEWEYEKLNLSPEVQEWITKVAYFGYEFSNHTDINYYYAAQMLIWEKIIPNDWKIYYTNTLGGEKINPYEQEQKEILTQIEKDNLVPSFANQTFEWNQQEILKLQDDTQSWKDYTVLDNSHVKMNEAKDILEISTLDLSPTTIEFRKEYLGNHFQFYYRKDGQNVLKRGALSPKMFQIHLKPYETKIEITKIDEEGTLLPHVEFSLSQKVGKDYQIISHAKTNAQGKIEWRNLASGEYCIEETLTPAEYQKNLEKKCIELHQNQRQISWTITNEFKRTKLILQKKDSETSEPLAKVHFQLWQNQTIIFDGYTNDQGVLEIPNLKNGEYQLREIETKDGYQLEKTPHMIQIDGTKEEINLTITNQKIPNVPNTKENQDLHSSSYLYIERRRKK